jgi:hypothetical protein
MLLYIYTTLFLSIRALLIISSYYYRIFVKPSCSPKNADVYRIRMNEELLEPMSLILDC